jgi:hypothetical protein
MLGASVVVFALVSAFMAFGSWPGSGSHTTVDTVVLRDAQRTRLGNVTVRANAVALARRAAQRAARTLALTHATPVATLPGTTGAGLTPGGSTPGSPGTPNVPGAPSVPTVPSGLDQTASQLTTTVQTKVAPVQKQVDEVIHPVAPPPPPVPATGTPADALLGH